ncbi:MAG: hypothetical protein QM783_18625 [Phycisphaerales bacterium]
MPTSKPSRARTNRPPARVEPPTSPVSRSASALPPHAPFEQAAAAVLSELQHAIADLFAAAPDAIEKIADVEHAFGVNHLLAWQLFRIVNAHNPLAAGLQVPAAVSIKKLLTAATRRKVPTTITDRIAAAFDAFEQLVKSEAGDRDEMDAMLSSFLPEERRKQDLAARQTAFKGMSQIKGVAAESMCGAFMIQPSPDGKTLDRAIIDCELGLRRCAPMRRSSLAPATSLSPTRRLRQSRALRRSHRSAHSCRSSQPLRCPAWSRARSKECSATASPARTSPCVRPSTWLPPTDATAHFSRTPNPAHRAIAATPASSARPPNG